LFSTLACTGIFDSYAYLKYAVMLQYCRCVAPAVQGGKKCLKGFSVQGNMSKARRNYTQLWEQIGSYLNKEGAKALGNFKLNILGGVAPGDNFEVPGMQRGPRDSPAAVSTGVGDRVGE
jgi:hypothetical protein